MTNIETLAASMRHAFLERQHTYIGGGEFTPEELLDGAIALKAIPALYAALDALYHYGHGPKTREDAIAALELVRDFK
jgi:hypothetical protein